ncbi:MAG: PIN domain-containing protein [Candidatus Thorarchaeota archaeon]|nr:PIN domain-containing protein [Candidatus Thorarchaeota archaeon]
MKTLLDTNIFVHAHNQASLHQEKAGGILREALNGHLEACITSQILYEFFSVVTNVRRVHRPLTADRAANICQDLLISGAIEIIEPQITTPSLVFELVRKHGITGTELFDCVLAATAKENNVKMLLTENVRDFEKYEFLTIRNPFE